MSDSQDGMTAKEAIVKYAWKGYTSVSFCPGCMTPLLTMDETEELVKTYLTGDVEGCKKIVAGKAAGFGFYVPSNEDMAQLLNHRCVLHPLCHDCLPYIKSPEYEARFERNLVASRRYLPIQKARKDEP